MYATIDSVGIATVEFGHPMSNSLPGKILQKLADTIIELGQNDEVKVIVLKSGETAVINLVSVSFISYPIGAITTSSPIFQSTCSINVIVVAFALIVLAAFVHVGFLFTP